MVRLKLSAVCRISYMREHHHHSILEISLISVAWQDVPLRRQWLPHHGRCSPLAQVVRSWRAGPFQPNRGGPSHESSQIGQQEWSCESLSLGDGIQEISGNTCIAERSGGIDEKEKLILSADRHASGLHVYLPGSSCCLSSLSIISLP